MTATIINLTQHPATAEQIAAGVQDLPAEARARLQSLLTFEQPPAEEDVLSRAEAIAEMAQPEGRPFDPAIDPYAAMIGGALWLMGPLAAALKKRGTTPLFAFSKRETVEEALPDGSVKKTQVFKHAGWVHAA